MTEETLIRIRWHGKESIDEAQQLIRERHDVEIDLPFNLHHALFAHLYPDADPGDPDFVDIEDGEVLLSKIAAIAGLELFGELINAVKETEAKVAVVSPTPRIFISFPQQG